MRTPKIHVISSLHHTPDEGSRHIFYSVLRACHYRVDPDFDMRSWTRPGHDLILNVRGAATVQLAKRAVTIGEGEFGWVNCARYNAFWHPRESLWELYWMRVDSPLLEPIAEALNVESNPVFVPHKTADAVAACRRIIKLMRERPVNLDAALHAALGSLIALLFEARLTAASTSKPAMPLKRGLGAALSAMRCEYGRHWTVDKLAQLADMSTSLFFRRFYQATGASPMHWLRRERISQAKRRLGETQARIGDIAEAVGYDDPLYFSRDFKKLVGVSPRQYRIREWNSP